MRVCCTYQESLGLKSQRNQLGVHQTLRLGSQVWERHDDRVALVAHVHHLVTAGALASVLRWC